MNAVTRPASQTPSDASARPRRPVATYALAGIVAGAALLFLLAAVFVLALSRAGGFSFGYGALAKQLILAAPAIAVVGLVAAAVIAVSAAVRRPSRSLPSTPVGSAPAGGARSRVVLLVSAAAVLAGSVLLLFVSASLGVGPDVSGRLVVAAVAVVGVAGVVTAAVVAIAAARGRATSLRTRTFGVIVVVVLIPSFCLAALGVWAYYRSWETASSLGSGQASYQAAEIAREVASVQRPRYTPEQRALLAGAIVRMYGVQGHTEGAQLATLDQIRATSTLPGWAIASLEKVGFSIGNEEGPGRLQDADTIAWRVGPNVVRYYVPLWTGQLPSPPVPLDRLAWIGIAGLALIVLLGLLGAWILSRSVVRPVRRLAEASGRLAEGEAGVTVMPEGPRELRELAVSFNDMNAKLSKAQETEQAFLLSVSHELKTPLTSIRGYAEGVGDGTIAAADGAVVIGAEAARLERLVGDLLESGRLRRSAFTVRREAVDLAAVAGDVARRYEATAQDAGLVLLLHTEAGGGAVADHDRVLQVVSNLVENAIRCTPAPGTVTISTAPAAITVADTGRGLTGDDLPRAFERFYLYTRYGTDRPVGTGLGLAIVKELTEAMGGSVAVASTVGVGTAFTVTLPAAAAPADAAPATAAPAKDDGS